MTLLTLPKQAFLPRRKLSEQEHRSFAAHRDRLFEFCRPDEQRCLIRCAKWYEAHDPNLLRKPNIFSESFVVDFYYRLSPRINRKPNPLVRALASVSGAISKVERWRGQRSQSSFTAHLRSLVDQGDEDVLLGVIHFFRILPLEMGFDGQRALEEKLDFMSGQCVGSEGVSASRRFDAVRRCVLWPSEVTGLRGRASASNLRGHSWRLLLAVSHEDVGAAVRLIDEHWKQSRSSEVLMSLHLHETPELAYQLAVKLRPYRVEFAVDMLRTSISNASFLIKKLDRPTATALEKVMDASCQLLADWTFGVPAIDAQNGLLSMGHLLQFGNPEDGYWRRVPRECLAVIKGLGPAEQDEQLKLLAQATFYAGSSSSFSIDAHELFKSCVTRKIGRARDWAGGLEFAISDVCGALSILENKVFSFRNRRVAANPDHVLLRTVDGSLEATLEGLLESEPSAALHHLVSLTLALSNETLIRKHHRILREEFDARARSCPADAGRALKKLIQYCGYSQVDDAMYRRELCRETFNDLLPVLEGISPLDAAVARSGIGWRPGL